MYVVLDAGDKTIIISIEMTLDEQYHTEDAITDFFAQTCTTRSACDAKALELASDKVVPVAIQGVCSYTGPELEYVVQFRLKSLELSLDTTILASQIYGSLIPRVDFYGMLGGNDDQADKKEPLLVYAMSRMRGISHLDFILANGYPENSETNFTSRRNLMIDIARYVTLCMNVFSAAMT